MRKTSDIAVVVHIRFVNEDSGTNPLVLQTLLHHDQQVFLFWDPNWKGRRTLALMIVSTNVSYKHLSLEWRIVRVVLN